MLRADQRSDMLLLLFHQVRIRLLVFDSLKHHQILSDIRKDPFIIKESWGPFSTETIDFPDLKRKERCKTFKKLNFDRAKHEHYPGETFKFKQILGISQKNDNLPNFCILKMLDSTTLFPLINA